jgi:hypothetical protein
MLFVLANARPVSTSSSYLKAPSNQVPALPSRPDFVGFPAPAGKSRNLWRLQDLRSRTPHLYAAVRLAGGGDLKDPTAGKSDCCVKVSCFDLFLILMRNGTDTAKRDLGAG